MREFRFKTSKGVVLTNWRSLNTKISEVNMIAELCSEVCDDWEIEYREVENGR